MFFNLVFFFLINLIGVCAIADMTMYFNRAELMDDVAFHRCVRLKGVCFLATKNNSIIFMIHDNVFTFLSFFFVYLWLYACTQFASGLFFFFLVWEKSKQVSFVPPDGKFTLLSFRSVHAMIIVVCCILLPHRLKKSSR